jgi:hypothetical protein
MATATIARPPQFPTVPSDMGSLRNTVVRFAQAINAMLQGSIGCTLQVTLAANATTSVFNDSRIGVYTTIALAPMTVHAADALPAVFVVASAGVATIHHPTSPNTDQTYTLTLIG